MKPVAWINKAWVLAFFGQREMAEDTEREREREGGGKALKEVADTHSPSSQRSWVRSY